MSLNMLNVLTVVLITLDLTGIINWSLWFILSPTIAYLSISSWRRTR